MLHVEKGSKTAHRIRMTLKRLDFPSARKERAWIESQFEAERLEEARKVVVEAIRAEGERLYRESVAPIRHTPEGEAMAWRNQETFELASKLEAFTFGKEGSS